MPPKRRTPKEVAVQVRKVDVVDCQVTTAAANEGVEAQDHQRPCPDGSDQRGASSRGHISPQSSMQRRLQYHRDSGVHT
jgi:hypothetical protein